MRGWWMALAIGLAAPAFAQDNHASHSLPEAKDHAGEAHAAGGHLSHDDTVVPKVPMLLSGYGNGGFAVTTQVPQAQAFFSNGLELHAAFAHSAAVKAMKEAVRLDPACAMCLWGEALVSGPNINFSTDEKARVPLAALMAKAAGLGGTPRERALIAALAERYRAGKPALRDRAYADAMGKLQARWPQDNEIAVLTADALMVATFGELPEKPDAAAQAAAEASLKPVLPLLEAVLARAPGHTPAIHFYIHATEILEKPWLAEAAADRLEALAPRASHLVHMPSHTYYWLGRYQDAADANRRAVEIGKENAARLGMGPPEGVWGLPYHSHNVVFGLGGAMMAGDSRTALDLGRPLVEHAGADDKAPPVMQLLSAAGWFAIARFDPAGALALPEPKLPYLKAAWHYARGEALAWRGDAAGVKAELAAIPESVAKPGVHDSAAPEQMLAIARGVLAGRAAMLSGHPDEAAAAFRKAADVEETPDFRQFSDPPAFWYPVRRDLAAALLAGGRPAEAAKEARASLAIRPRDAVAEATLAAAVAVGQGARLSISNDTNGK